MQDSCYAPLDSLLQSLLYSITFSSFGMLRQTTLMSCFEYLGILVAHVSSKTAVINLSAVRNRSQLWRVFKYCNAFSLKQVVNRQQTSFLDAVTLRWWMTAGSGVSRYGVAAGQWQRCRCRTETSLPSLSACGTCLLRGQAMERWHPRLLADVDRFVLGETVVEQRRISFLSFLEWQWFPESLQMFMLAVIKQCTELLSTVRVKMCSLTELELTPFSSTFHSLSEVRWAGYRHLQWCSN